MIKEIKILNKTASSLAAIMCMTLTYPTHGLADDNVVNVYSFRKAELITPLINEFTNKTGIKVNLSNGKADKLIQRLINDGNNSFADVLLTVDVARLEEAKRLDLLQPISSHLLRTNIPADLRDPENFWFGLSLRARAIFYAKDKVTPDQIRSYQDLTTQKWQGKICSRQGSHFYNVSMVASFIYRYGVDWTKKWVGNFANNLAMRPNGGDGDQLRKVAKGECQLALANSYYYGALATSNKASDRDVYQKVGIVFPKKSTIGTHVNISGAALTRSSKHKINAIKFIEFLTTKAAQEIYANNNYEYPIHTGMQTSRLLKSWGKLIPDTKSVLQLTKYHPQAKEIIQQNSW